MSKTSELRSYLDAPELTLVPGCHDALGARLIESASFPAVYISGFSFASSRGKPDIGILTMRDVVERAAEIAQAVDLPVITDADTGYGGPNNISECVRALERAGLAGLHLEDQVMPKKCGAMAGKQLVDDAEMALRIQVALEARTDPDFLIIARTDALTLHGIDEAARRCKAMEAAGADAVMVPSLCSVEEFETITHAVDVPVIYLAAETIRPMFGRDTLQQAGFSMAFYPLTLIQMSVAAQRHALSSLLETGTTEHLIDAMEPFSEIGKLVGNEEASALEQRFTHKDGGA